MICKSVSREEIRALKVGQTGIYTLPDVDAMESVRVQFSSMKSREGADFERITMDELKQMLGADFGTVVTDEKLTMAYRKTKAGRKDNA
ncbi:MAG: hypothetical protein IJ271_03565 [Bacteroidales bacterium]|nr:hypothetical protein [Bacteroidales bacterium]